MSKINEGVILKTVNYSENDKIITIFTSSGVVTVIAKSLKGNIAILWRLLYPEQG